MAGVKGAGGPPPKRSSQRRRTNKLETPITKGTASAAVAPPSPDEGWHPVARRWFESLAVSGQSVFYEPSDWATAFVVAEAMSRELKPQPMSVGQGDAAHVEFVSLPPKGASLSAWLRAMTVLMVTEGDRRRLRLELEAVKVTEEAAPDVSELAEYRRRSASRAG